MSYGPRSETRSLVLVDVSAPGTPVWVLDPVQDPVTGKIKGRLLLPSTDANGAPLSGLATLAIAYNLNNGFDPAATMEDILADTNNSRLLIPVTPAQAGTEVDFEVDPLGTSGDQIFTAACAD